MFDKLLIALGIAIVLYVTWIFVTASYPNLFDKKDTFISPSMAPPVEQEIPIEPPRVVAPSGPASPNAAPSASQEATLSPEVKGSDPFQEEHPSSNLKDDLRHPERLFSAGVRNIDTSLGPASGASSMETQVSGQALQMFAPENAMNGGFFMGGIAANDTTSNAEFAAF
jgi:hypothetical protein